MLIQHSDSLNLRTAMTLEAWDGTPVNRYQLLAAETLGTQLAYYALVALGPDGGSVTDETADLAFRTVRFYLSVENRRYHIAFLNGLFTRELYNYDPDRPVRNSNIPDLETETGLPAWAAEPILKAFPRVWSYGDGAYSCSVLPASRTVELEPLDAKARKQSAPPVSALPRLYGFRVTFKQGSRRLTLRS